MADYTTIDDPAKYFTSFLWTGDGNSPRSLTGVGFQADFMWSKIRDTGHEHRLIDSVRGVDNKRLKSDSTAAEDTTNTHGHFDSLDSDGFTVTGASGYWNVNTNTKTYVGWFWKGSGGSGSADSNGTINTTSTSANTTSLFSVSTYTGNNSNAQTIGHGLGVAPKVYLQKRRDDTSAWGMYHGSLGTNKYLQLESTNAQATDTGIWNNTAPTSTVVSLGNAGYFNNVSSATYVSYAFGEVQGYSKFGSFEGNNNADGSFVYLGFKPAWIIIKDIDSSNTVGGSAATSWGIWDNKRMPANPASNPLWANQNGTQTIRGNNSSANTGGTDGNGLGGFIHLDMLSNGFKCRCATGELNDAQTYVYMAFAEAPFVNSNGVPCNAR